MLLRFGQDSDPIRTDSQISYNVPLSMAQKPARLSLLNSFDFTGDDMFTVCVRDVDAPGGTLYHYLRINANKLLEGGTAILSYEKPMQVGHRYVYEIYKQPVMYNVKGNTRRQGLDFGKIIKAANLRLVGRVVVKTTNPVLGGNNNAYGAGSPIASGVVSPGSSPRRPERDYSSPGSSPRRADRPSYGYIPPMASQMYHECKTCGRM